MSFARAPLSMRSTAGQLRLSLLPALSRAQSCLFQRHLNHQSLAQQLRRFSYVPRGSVSAAQASRLRSMEQEADARPQDSDAQLRFLRTASMSFPELVILRVESGKFALTDQIMEEYNLARQRLGKDRLESLPRSATTTVATTSSFDPPSWQQPPAAPIYHHHYQPQQPSSWSPQHSMPAWQGAQQQQHSWYGSSDGHSAGRGGNSSSEVGQKLQEIANSAEVIADELRAHRPHPMRRIFPLVMMLLLGYTVFPYLAAPFGLRSDDEEGPKGGIVEGVLMRAASSGGEFELDMSGNRVTFDDVHGIDECKDEVMEIVAYLKNREQFGQFGARMPAGLLMAGPPGTGKTLLAKAMATEAGVPILYATGTSFEEMFVGVGASRVRKLFAEARKKAPCIIFIDEIDGIGGRRRGVTENPNGTLLQLLAEMDGFKGAEGIVVIGATNRPDTLDSALTRPGRFDKTIQVPLPDLRGRASIIRSYLKKVKLAEPLNALDLARTTVGMSGAQLANLVNLAAVTAANRMVLRGENVTGVSLKDIEEARERVTIGLARKSVRVSEEDRRLTAYHEGGHTLVALLTPGARPLHKVSILPRGSAGGVTHFQLEKDESYHSHQQLRAQLIVAMGGRCAEQLIFGEENVTTGPMGDLQQATNIAQNMVARFGMGKQTGLAVYEEAASPDAQRLIEQEVRDMLQEASDEARRLLETNKRALDALASALLEYETLSADEVRRVIDGMIQK